jgi:phosphatidate cytidylyltransferase
MMVFLIFTIVGLHEFYNILNQNLRNKNYSIPVFIGSLIFLITSFVALDVFDPEYLLINILLILLLFIFEIVTVKEDFAKHFSLSLSGIVYISLPFALLNYFYDPGYLHLKPDYGLLLGFFIIVWIYDVGAYIIGSLIGRNKLFERVSPKKTWEGAIGGALFCILAAYGISHILDALSITDWIVFAMIIVVFGTFGDLFESMIKRSVKVKDSGTILPGHGGVLDRFDSVFFAAPAVYVYLIIFVK